MGAGDGTAPGSLWSASDPEASAGEGELPEDRLQGTVDRITFHAESTGYTVLKLRVERGCKDFYGTPLQPGTRVTAVGPVIAPDGPPPAGARVRLRGTWGKHAAHGLQFEFEVLEPLLPLGEDGVARYLSSKAFRGIGPKLAQRIVAKLGGGALDIIRTEPDRLTGIRGLTDRVRDDLVDAVRAQYVAHRAHAFLADCGLGPTQAALVLRKLGSECETLIRSDPYVIARGIRGIGFQLADRVAQRLGLAQDHPLRLRAAVVHSLEDAAGDGHSMLEVGRVVDAARELLGASEEEGERLHAALDELVQERELMLEVDLREGARLVYLPRYHVCESQLAANLAALASAENREATRPLATRDDLAKAEERNAIALHPLQREAVLGLLREPVGLLTGGPGVGKTTIVRLLVELAEWAGAKVKLASPTGRAAKRLAEATGRDASTIHRLLGFDPEKGGFRSDARNPIEADLIIVDELSMLDVILAHHLVKAVERATRLIFVGDPNQLPAVGAGAVLADLLASGVVPTWRLTQIYRQGEGSSIVTNAYRILTGETPEFSTGASGEGPSDFFFFPADDERAAAARTVDVVTRRVPQTFGLDWVEDVQVLCPMYRGACGVDELNRALREALGSGGVEVQRGDRIWRTGDRVIHTRNDYEKEVFNGDMGRISQILADGSGLRVRFPEREVFYEPDEYRDLSPAFAITVHRSQGGEFPAVVFPLVTAHFMMLQRHLLYTAVTRARQLVVLVGSRRALDMAIANAEQRNRESALADRLRSALASGTG